jgi:hypothetical protein
VTHPGAPEPWPEGIEVVVLPGTGTYVEGSFAPGGAGPISALDERGIAVAAFGDPRHAYSYADLGWYGTTVPRLSGSISEVLQRISTRRWDAGLIARVSRHGSIASG